MVAPSDSPKPPKLLEQVIARLRVKHYSLSTEKVYVDWIKRFVWFHGKRHPKELGAADVEAFLSHLAVERSVSASTQNQAKSALLFLYKEVLQLELPWLDNVTQAKAPKRLPVVMTENEVRAVLARTAKGISIAIVFHKQPTSIAPEIIAAFMCADAMLGCSCIEVK